MTTLHDFTLDTITGQPKQLGDYAGKTLLVVNVASKCGLTPQYEGLQALYDSYRGRGLEILGFPCNQFLEQEPAGDEEIASFCTTNYSVSFPMFSKIEVNGEGRSPLYAFLTAAQSAPDGPGDIVWNFAKFLVDARGAVVGRYSPQAEPRSEALVAAIESQLG